MNALRGRGWLVAGVIFLLGLALGSAGTAWLGVRRLRQAVQAPAGTRSLAERAAERIGADLTQSLQLSAEEAARVRAILDESAGQLRRIRVKAALEAGAELRATTKRLADALPPEKHAALYRVVGERYERLGLEPPQPTP